MYCYLFFPVPAIYHLSTTLYLLLADFSQNRVCFFVLGREEFLHDVAEAALSEDVERVLRIEAKSIFDKLEAFLAGYEGGLLSVQNLLEILVSPFLKIAKRVNVSQKKSVSTPDNSKLLAEKSMLDSLLHDWDRALVFIVRGPYVLDSKGVWRMSPKISPEKRAKVLRAMMTAKFPQVSGLSFSEGRFGLNVSVLLSFAQPESWNWNLHFA